MFFHNGFIKVGKVACIGAIFDGGNNHAGECVGGSQPVARMRVRLKSVAGGCLAGETNPQGQRFPNDDPSGMPFRLLCPKDLVAFLDHGKEGVRFVQDRGCGFGEVPEGGETVTKIP